MRLLLASLLLSLSVGAGWLARPTLTLEAFTPDSDRLVWCARPDEDTLIVYTSMNSIYGVPVREEWRVTGAGVRVSRVVSAPIVLDYYGIADYTVRDDGQAVGHPGYVYASLTLRLTEQGDQWLTVDGQATRLWDITPTGRLELRPASRPWLLACR